jgi:competence protein ComFC
VCVQCRPAIQDISGETACEKCGTPLVSEQGICRRCRESDYCFAGNVALFSNHGPVKELVRQLKFSHRRRLAAYFAQWAARALERRYPGMTLVPVPSRPGSKTPDAVQLVCRCLAKYHDVQVRSLLRRTPGVAQKTLDFQRRRENLRGRILLVPGVTSAASALDDLVLFDDVFTTGATVDTCARALLDAGAHRVFSLTLVIEE